VVEEDDDLLEEVEPLVEGLHPGLVPSLLPRWLTTWKDVGFPVGEKNENGNRSLKSFY
jgi:hypothetical protein